MRRRAMASKVACATASLPSRSGCCATSSSSVMASSGRSARSASSASIRLAERPAGVSRRRAAVAAGPSSRSMRSAARDSMSRNRASTMGFANRKRSVCAATELKRSSLATPMRTTRLPYSSSNLRARRALSPGFSRACERMSSNSVCAVGESEIAGVVVCCAEAVVAQR